MARAKAEVLKLPDSLLVRYYRQDEIHLITKVTVSGKVVTVTLGKRVDRWEDLDGGLGYVPASKD